jgi:hypothetical protein
MLDNESNNINSLKDRIFSKKKNSSTEDTILWIQYEFKMSYEEVMNLPIPAYFVYIEFLNKMYSEKEKAANKKKK